MRQAFVKTLILNHFDLEYYIQIKTDISGYAISRILSQLTLNDLGQWYSIAFFSKKMIPTEIWYKIHDGELLAIVEAFKTWKYYFKNYKYEVFMLTDHNNLQHFIDTKSLSSRQVW